MGAVRICRGNRRLDCNVTNWQLKVPTTMPSAFNSKEEEEIAQKYPGFFKHATRGELAILVAISLLRNLVLTSDSSPAMTQTAKTLRPLLPDYARILRTANVWNKLTEKERLSIDHDLFSDP